MEAGVDNKSMAGIDFVNLRQWCKTNCITARRGGWVRQEGEGAEREQRARGEEQKRNPKMQSTKYEIHK